MPKISHKGKLMPESPIRKLVPYSEIAKKKREQSIPFEHWSTGHKNS